MKACWPLCAVLFFALPASGQERQFLNAEPVSIREDTAYVLIRTSDMDGGGIRGTLHLGPIFARPLEEAEMAQADKMRSAEPDRWKEKVASNVVELIPPSTYTKQGRESVLLAAVKPGTYVLAGVAAESWATKDFGAQLVSLCMGTVKFEAKAGVITDLGELLVVRDDKPTPIPELAGAVTGKSTALSDRFLYAVGIRPMSERTPVPQYLATMPRVRADYQVVPAFPNYAGGPLGRLAPLPGVLDYDENGDVRVLKK